MIVMKFQSVIVYRLWSTPSWLRSTPPCGLPRLPTPSSTLWSTPSRSSCSPGPSGTIPPRDGEEKDGKIHESWFWTRWPLPDERKKGRGRYRTDVVQYGYGYNYAQYGYPQHPQGYAYPYAQVCASVILQSFFHQIFIIYNELIVH